MGQAEAKGFGTPNYMEQEKPRNFQDNKKTVMEMKRRLNNKPKMVTIKEGDGKTFPEMGKTVTFDLVAQVKGDRREFMSSRMFEEPQSIKMEEKMMGDCVGLALYFMSKGQRSQVWCPAKDFNLQEISK